MQPSMMLDFRIGNPFRTLPVKELFKQFHKIKQTKYAVEFLKWLPDYAQKILYSGFHQICDEDVLKLFPTKFHPIKQFTGVLDIITYLEKDNEIYGVDNIDRFAEGEQLTYGTDFSTTEICMEDIKIAILYSQRQDLIIYSPDCEMFEWLCNVGLYETAGEMYHRIQSHDFGDDIKIRDAVRAIGINEVINVDDEFSLKQWDEYLSSCTEEELKECNSYFRTQWIIDQGKWKEFSYLLDPKQIEDPEIVNYIKQQTLESL